MKENSTLSATVEPSESLTACLQWACNPRGGNNFYGRILNGCGKKAAPGLGTAAVQMDQKGRYCFLWDPEWFSQKEKSFQLMIIVHEAGHLALRHLERMCRIRLSINDTRLYRRLHQVLMVAADMAVNDITLRPMLSQSPNFQKVYEELIWPESKKYPQGLSMEQYFVLLLKDLKKDNWESGVSMAGESAQIPGKSDRDGDTGDPGDATAEKDGGGGKTDTDDKPEWFKNLAQKLRYDEAMEKMFDEMTDAEIERALNRAKREVQKMVKAAVEQTQKCHGTIPGSIQKAIDALLEEPTIPWTQVLMGYVKSEIALKLDESTTQPNPAYMHLAEYGIAPYPGYQHNFTFRIVSCFDTSGSVSDDEYMDFVSELHGVTKAEEGVTVRLIMFDSAIQYECMLDEDMASDRSNARNRCGYGGTSFTPPLKYLCGKATDNDWEHDAEKVQGLHDGPPDLVLMFTDGYAPVESPEGPIPEFLPPCPLIWVLTASGQEHPLMQPRVLRINR